uniref:Uncharacterized protein n=1 Tax=Lepeophtheirus salmonis TaxID=72036 RepID=A0A0K2UE17_LEPSM
MAKFRFMKNNYYFSNAISNLLKPDMSRSGF